MSSTASVRTAIARATQSHAGPSRIPAAFPPSLVRQPASHWPPTPLRLARPISTQSSFQRLPSTSTQRIGTGLGRRWKSTASESATQPEVETEGGGRNTLGIDAPEEGATKQQFAKIEPRLSLTMTCTADGCGHRSTHEFSKRSYESGIVLIQCPSCKNRHLIADHLGWFKESLEGGKLKTVEDLLRAKGEKIRKGRVGMDGDIEYDGE